MDDRIPITTSSSCGDDNDEADEEEENNEEDDDDNRGDIKEEVDEHGEKNFIETPLRFRNYKPQTHFLKGMYSTWKSEPESILPYIEDKLRLIAEPNNDSANADNKYKIDQKMLESKKVDWDLKRRNEKRMEKLERETRKNIEKHIKTRTKTSR